MLFMMISRMIMMIINLNKKRTKMRIMNTNLKNLERNISNMGMMTPMTLMITKNIKNISKNPLCNYLKPTTKLNLLMKAVIIFREIQPKTKLMFKRRCLEVLLWRILKRNINLIHHLMTTMKIATEISILINNSKIMWPLLRLALLWL